MKKITLILTAFILIINYSALTGCQKNKNPHASSQEKNVQLVPESVAENIAKKFNPSVFFNEKNADNHYPVKTTLTGTNKIKQKFVLNDSYGKPGLYVFNFENNAGFLFVSADYQLQPVLGFVQSGEFKKDTVPSGIIQWAERTMENIEIVRKGLYDNSKVAAIAWDTYADENTNHPPVTSMAPPTNPCTPPQSTTVGPLLSVTWGQGCTYNNLCPEKACNLGCGTSNAWTGCVATSTAQIINYWHPNNRYSYDYASMPKTSGNTDVQRLMRDLGLEGNLKMDYGCEGSGANSRRVDNTLKSNFGFASANYSNYNSSDCQKIISNLNSRWPVLLGGCRTKKEHEFIIDWWNTYKDCHEWVCDGYRETSIRICDNGVLIGGASYLYFHMNWGWHEWSSNPPYNYSDYNGWFAFDNWNITQENRNYQYNQDITSEIHP